MDFDPEETLKKPVNAAILRELFLELDFHKPFVNVSILSGEGTLDGEKLSKGDHLLLTADYGTAKFEGDLEFIWSYI